jgi:hypothetical protein
MHTLLQLLFIFSKVHALMLHEGVSESFRTGRLYWELQMVHLSATRCSCVAILWVRLVRFAAITLCVTFEWVFVIVSIYFIINSVWKLLDTPSYLCQQYGVVLPKDETASSSYTNLIHLLQYLFWFWTPVCTRVICTFLTVWKWHSNSLQFGKIMVDGLKSE